MDGWHVLLNKTSGNIESVFSGTPTPEQLSRFDVIDVGDTKPNFAVVYWDNTLRTFMPRPLQQFVDRLDDLAANPDWQTINNRLTAGQRPLLRNLMTRMLGNRRMRLSDEPVDPE
jgi:hypothetical protein